jgi:mono/diheme cytochrome c family protein
MTLRAPLSLALLAALGVLPAVARARQDVPPATTGPVAAMATDSGDYLFRTYCASCHGRDARGDGTLASSLRVRPADLTRFAKRNGGKFDAGKLAKLIDGREEVKGHGSSDMPVWGDAFKRASERYSEDGVKARVAALVEYLEGLQVK